MHACYFATYNTICTQRLVKISQKSEILLYEDELTIINRYNAILIYVSLSIEIQMIKAQRYDISKNV